MVLRSSDAVERGDRPGILKVFWPAFLGWGSVAIPAIIKLAAPVLAFDIASINPFPIFAAQVAGLALALLGALVVMRAYPEANGCFALAANFSVLVAWLLLVVMWIVH